MNTSPPWEPWTVVKKGLYLYARIPNHPNATANGYVLEHRAVAENCLGRLLLPEEHIHHLNEDKHDNRPENLCILDRATHSAYHGRKRGQVWLKIRCPWCLEIFERAKNQTLNKKRLFCSYRCKGSYSRALQLGRDVPDEEGTGILSTFTKFFIFPEIQQQFVGGQESLAKYRDRVAAERAPNKNHCLNCGKKIDPQATRCASCAGLLSRKVERPTKEQLEKDISTINWCAIGRKYGVTDNAVRKWARSYGIRLKC